MRAIHLSLAFLGLLSACKGADAGEGPPTAKTTLAPAPAPRSPATNGDFVITSEFYGSQTGKIGAAHAYISGSKESPEVKLWLFNANLAGKDDCGAEVSDFGTSLLQNQTSFELSTDALDHVPTASKPVKATDVHYTVYFRTKEEKKGSNAGGHRDSTIEITQLDDHIVKGTYRHGDEIVLNFTAKVCPKEPQGDVNEGEKE